MHGTSVVLLSERNLHQVNCYNTTLTSARVLTMSSTPNQVPRQGGNIPLYQTKPGKNSETPITSTKTVLPCDNCRPNAIFFQLK